jgi:hypothetical protein
MISRLIGSWSSIAAAQNGADYLSKLFRLYNGASRIN